MAFTYLKLTTFGQNLDAKCKLGKGLHLSRVAIGDGLLGSGSMVNRTALVSEKFSMLIDAKQLTEESAVAAIISTLDNSSFTEGFPYRELGVMGVDPDTSQEGLYLYDNAGEECEYLDTQANGVTIYERLKLLIKTEDIDSITFDPSGNPLYITVDEKGAADGVASLGSDGKVPSEQLPTMNYEAPIKDQVEKATPVDADKMPVVDSADSSKTKLILWSTIKSLFAAATHSHAWGTITDKPSSFTPTAHAASHKTGGTDALTASDIGAAAASHTHAGLVPSGSVFYFAASSAPTGYLECNGAELSRTTYANLFAIIGTTFGVGDGSTTFALPDLRGEFVRGYDNGRGVDSSRVFGSAQAGTNLSDRIASNGSPLNITNGESVGSIGSQWAFQYNSSNTATRYRFRPNNVALLPCIKY